MPAPTLADSHAALLRELTQMTTSFRFSLLLVTDRETRNLGLALIKDAEATIAQAKEVKPL